MRLTFQCALPLYMVLPLWGGRRTFHCSPSIKVFACVILLFDLQVSAHAWQYPLPQSITRRPLQAICSISVCLCYARDMQPLHVMPGVTQLSSSLKDSSIVMTEQHLSILSVRFSSWRGLPLCVLFLSVWFSSQCAFPLCVLALSASLASLCALPLCVVSLFNVFSLSVWLFPMGGAKVLSLLPFDKGVCQ